MKNCSINYRTKCEHDIVDKYMLDFINSVRKNEKSGTEWLSYWYSLSEEKGGILLGLLDLLQILVAFKK
jgi:hypothetical protein